MIGYILPIALQNFLACGPKAPVVEVIEPPAPLRMNTEKPAPLEAKAFELPTASVGTLSNGIKLVVSENHESPLIDVQVVFHAGSWQDKNPVLARATMEMLSEGAGSYDASQLSAESRKLAASIQTAASLDGSVVYLSSLAKNIDASVGLLSTVVQKPTFPQKSWTIVQNQYIQELQAEEQDPNRIARSVYYALMYNKQYAGRMTSKEDIQSITTKDMQKWHSTNIAAQNATIYVGGDTTLAEIQPIIEKHFASMKSNKSTLPKKPSTDMLPESSATTIYLVDRPKASQSVIYAGQFLPERLDAASEELYLANLAIGGLFIARINMNLREDKGWTYGARSSIGYNYLPGLWTTSTSVVAQYTADAVQEILKEIRESQVDRPITEDELNAGRGYLLGTEPLKYESPSYILSQMITVDRYSLPTEYYSTYNQELRTVNLEQAQQAWNTYIDPNALRIVVVGDKATLQGSLLNLGLTIVELDAKANVISK